MPQVKCRIIQASGLHENVKHYVEVRINDIKAFTTSTVKGVTPFWDQTKVIQFDGPETAKMKFLIYQDKSLGKAKMVAHCACFLRDLAYQVPAESEVRMVSISEAASSGGHNHGGATAHTGHTVNLRLVLTALDFGRVEHPVEVCAPVPCAPVDTCIVEDRCHEEPVVEQCYEPSPMPVYCPPPAPVVVREVPVYQPPPPTVAPVVMVKVQDSRLEEELRRIDLRYRQHRAAHRDAMEEGLRRRDDLQVRLRELRDRESDLVRREHLLAHHISHPVHHKKLIVEEYVVVDDEDDVPSSHVGSVVRTNLRARPPTGGRLASTYVPSVASTRLSTRM